MATGYIVSGFINAAVNGINGHFLRKQQERLFELNRDFQEHMEKNRQGFQRGQRKRTEELQRELNLLNIAANVQNARQAQEQQERIFEMNCELQIQMEKNRQKFQLKQSKFNAQFQRELCLKNHELRLAEQQVNFENLCKKSEWELFLKNWPLLNLPSVIREEQILPDGTVSLRVFFTRSSDPVFTRAVYPRVEQGLSEFADLYHNEFGSKNIIFYHNGFSSEVSGGAVISNIHYALRELPVIIIDSNVLFDEICISLTMWGFGSGEKSHFTVFKLPYEQHTDNGRFSVKYYSELADQLLSRLKFILGYAYDAYNLIQYNRPPLLPRIVRCEAGLGVRGCLPDDPEAKKAIREKYDEIYSMVLGDSAPDGRLAFALHPDSFKGCILHRIRMEYAGAMREYLTDEQFFQYLDDSVKAWAALRTSESAEDFLSSLADGSKYVPDYVDESDQQYLDTLSALYDSVRLEGRWSLLVKRICDIQKKTKDIQKDGCPHQYQLRYAEAIREYLTDKQFRRCLDGSVESWTALHGSESAGDFLRMVANSGICDAARYISRDDRPYFETLNALYNSIETQSPYSLSVKKICDVQHAFHMTIDKVYTASCGRNTVDGYVESGQMAVGGNYEIAGKADSQGNCAVMKCLALSFGKKSKDGSCVVKCVLEGDGVYNIKEGQLLTESNVPAPSPDFSLETAAFLMSVMHVADVVEKSDDVLRVFCHGERGLLETGQTVEFLDQPDDERRFAVVEILNNMEWISVGDFKDCRLHIVGGSIHIEEGQVLGKPGAVSSIQSSNAAVQKPVARKPAAAAYTYYDPWRQYETAPSAVQKPQVKSAPATPAGKRHETASDSFRMPIEEVYVLPGRGSVVRGHIEAGELKEGEIVEIVSQTNEKYTTIVLGIEMFRKRIDYVTAGDHAGILLRDVANADIKSGQVLTKPG